MDKKLKYIILLLTLIIFLFQVSAVPLKSKIPITIPANPPAKNVTTLPQFIFNSTETVTITNNMNKSLRNEHNIPKDFTVNNYKTSGNLIFINLTIDGRQALWIGRKSDILP